MAGFLLGAAGMFAVTYSTQAILPLLGRTFHVSPSQAGLTISIVILALAIGAWIWGPLSDRWGRKRSIVLASLLLVAPTIGAAADRGWPVGRRGAAAAESATAPGHGRRQRVLFHLRRHVLVRRLPPRAATVLVRPRGRKRRLRAVAARLLRSRTRDARRPDR